MQAIDFIVNPISGGKDKSSVAAAILKYLDTTRFQARICTTEGPGAAAEMARRSDAGLVVAVGGDGTVSEVASALVGSGKKLGIIPCGSGDGLALHLGISRTASKAVSILNEGCVAAIDVAEMNGRYFFCTAGVGLDANVSLDFAQSTRRGLSHYISLAWEEWKNHPGEEYRLETDGESWSGKAVFVTFANAGQWGNQARIAPMASLQDGLLDVMVVRPFTTLEIPDMATRLMTGLADTSRHVLHFSGTRFHLHRSRPGAVHYDGDPFEAGTDFDLSIHPGALQVVVPASHLNKI